MTVVIPPLYPAGAPEVQPGAMPFDSYRQLCDAQDSYRATGILDAEGYEKALHDPTTIYYQVGGQAVPALVRIGYEGGYDTERTKDMTGCNDTMLLSIPLSMVMEDGLPQERLSGGDTLSEEYAVVIEDPRKLHETDREGRQQRVAGYLSTLGIVEVNDFVDEDAKPGHRTAEMNLYSLSYGPTEEARRKPSASNLDGAWQLYRQDRNLPEKPSATSQATYMYNGTQMRQHPELVDALWAISEIGFGQKLGKDHPVSMEESREFFEEYLFKPNNHTAIRYDEGQPVCFGSMLVDPRTCEWFNPEGSTDLQRELADAAACNETVMYFSEVISNGKVNAAYAMDIFKLFADLSGMTHEKSRLLFESTNRSSQYIPRGVQRAVDNSESVKFTSISRKVEKVARMDYWWAKVKKHEDKPVALAA